MSRAGPTPDRTTPDSIVSGEGIGERTVAYRLHRLATLRVGGETIRGPQIMVSEFSEPGVDLILGMPFLRDRQVFVSHATARMFVRPNAGAPRLAEGHE